MSNYPIEVDGTPVYFIDDMNSDDERSDPELYSSSSMASGSAETLASSDVHGKWFSLTRAQFSEDLYGRMFPSDANVAINLPQDSAEVQRCLDHHQVFKMILGAKYWGPVEQVLAPTPGETERKKVLDMVTAEGSWVQEMAQQFPHVDFLSVDNVPLTSHVPRSNIAFEVYDLYNGFAAPDASCDVIRNPKDVIRDVYRVLKPGGLFLFSDSEIDCFDARDPEFPAGDKLPGLTAGSQFVCQALSQQGVNPYLWRDLPELLSPESELWLSRRGPDDNKQIGFRNIRFKSHLFPANTWPEDPHYKELGRLAGQTWKAMWKSMEVPFRMYGMDPDMAKQLIQGTVQDIDRTDVAVAAKYHTLYAFKI
ncbi:hypothetical protein FRC10_007257 [Ceratobasidium sp. 414]|nr:hypothetical protein FRC10_007257 [Ceratobasidium sp. 414]